jgi:hypothetical protein
MIAIRPLVSDSEYRITSIRIELCRQVSFRNSPGNESALPGS